MKKHSFLLLIAFIATAFAFAQVNPQNKTVKGYSKKNGTYVLPHNRTVENATNRDNYTTKPSANPYTGKRGYIVPDNKLKSIPSNRKRK